MKYGFGLIFSLFLGSAFALQAHAVALPDSQQTPGLVCTTSDPDFRGLDYPEQIARCKRNVSYQQKLQIAKFYGEIPQEEWPNYEFDHLIPLCAGGSNSSKNIWPQPLDQAKRKDVLENDICLAMRAGTLTQAAAIQKVKDWIEALKARNQQAGGDPGALSAKTSDEFIIEKALKVLAE